MALVVKVIFVTLCIVTSKAIVTCTSGECVVDCESQICDIVICTNYASSCLITCSDGQCEGSQFYLAARNYNTVYCFGDNACNEINVQCGGPDMPPIGYSEYDFIGRYDSKLKCNFVSKPTSTNNPTSDTSESQSYPTKPPTIKPTIPTTNSGSQIKELSAASTPSGSKSILGMEVLIVLGAVGLFCLMFTICFCICMAVDNHEKMIILKEHTEESVAGLPPSVIVEKPNAAIAVKSVSPSALSPYHTRTPCTFYGDKSNTKSSIGDSCNTNSNAASSNVASAESLSVAVPSFRSTANPDQCHESERSGVYETHIRYHKHVQVETESETNLPTLTEFESNRTRTVFRSGSSGSSGSEDTAMTMNTVRVHDSDSMIYLDPADCQLCDFSKMLMERQTPVAVRGVYHD